MTARRLLLPREHGAWGMMLQPFVAGAILSGSAAWELLPALVAVVGVFVLREPLLVLARQKYVWRDTRPETADAKWSVAVELVVLAICGLLLMLRVPPAVLAGLGSLALGLSGTAVWMALRNRQRSMVLQSLSAFGLSSSAVIAGYAATGTWQSWMLPLFLLLGMHSLSGIFAVHTRLDAMAGLRNPDKMGAQAAGMRRRTIGLLGLNAIGAAGLVIAGLWLYALPVVLSVCGMAIEVWRLQWPGGLKEPLKKVGWRALGLAVSHTLVVVAVLWKA